jgi:hypothetical protein
MIGSCWNRAKSGQIVVHRDRILPNREAKSLWCRTSSWSFLTQLSAEWLRLAPNIPNVSTMPLRLFTMASRLAKNTSRMPQDWTKSARLPTVLNMSKTAGRFQELSWTTTIALEFHHGYSRITPMSKLVVIRGKNRDIWMPIKADSSRLCKIRDEPWHNWVQNNRGHSGKELGQCVLGFMVKS